MEDLNRQPIPSDTRQDLVSGSLMPEGEEKTEEGQQEIAAGGLPENSNECSKKDIIDDCFMKYLGAENDDISPMEVEAPVPEDGDPVEKGDINSSSVVNNSEKNEINTDRSGSSVGSEWVVFGLNDAESNATMSCDDPSEQVESSDDDFSFGTDDGVDDFSKIPSEHFSSIGKAFNMDLLRDCIAKGEDNLHRIEDQDVILVVGKTGTGKSTLIQGIAGKDFMQSFYTCTNEEGYTTGRKEVFDAVDAVPGFEIGHAKSSKTKHIQCHVHNQNREIKKNKFATRSPKTLYFLDTPGFEDTEGEEVDIATSAMLAQVAKKCRSMRFIIMIHYVSLLEDRGGAMRSALKFMRNFVPDFNEHKQSFMFLFTHADEIKDVPESLEGARKSLLNEINLTIDGTKSDDDATDLLLFIRKCLQKKYLFVDILHPLKSDFAKISNFVEKKLKPIKAVPDLRGDNGSTSSCIFTNTSKMRLIGAVRKLLSNLRLSLKETPVNIKEVREIQNTFRYFEKYIQFEEMRAAVIDCNEVISGHIKHLHRFVSNELRNGTTTSSDSLFNECNVSFIKDALMQLQAIDSTNFDMQAECERITREVVRLQKGLFLDKASEFHSFHGNLQKLHAWCTLDLDSGYQKLFDEVVTQANALVKQVVGEVTSFQASQVCSSTTSTSEVTAIFSSLKVLKSIQENMRGLSSCLAGISEASDTYNDFVCRLKRYFETLDEHLSSIQLLDFRNPQSIQDLASQIRALEKLSGLIDDTNLQDDISPLVRDVRELVETQTVEKFGKACVESEINYISGGNQCSSNDLKLLRDVQSTFSTFEGARWKEVEFSYKTVVDRIKSNLKAKSGELDEMSRNTTHHGVEDGNRDGEAVIRFAKWQWFDEFLPQEERFVKNCFEKIKNDYFRRLQATASTIEATLRRLSSNAKNSKSHQPLIEGTKVLKTKLAEIVECANFGSAVVDERVQSNVSRLFREVQEYMKRRAIDWGEILKAWVEMITNKDPNWKELTVLTETLDVAIGEISEAINMPSGTGGKVIKRSQCMKDKFIAALSNFDKKVQRSLSSRMSYDEFALLLARVQALGAFPHTAPHLPRIEALKEIARNRVAKHAKKIEDMVEETSKFDEIDNLMKDFEKSVVLNEFISQEAESRLRPLKRLRKEKEVAADQIVSEMIEKNDYSGLGDFLKPLAETKDQLRKTKFNKSIEMIATSLDSIDDKLKNELEGKMTEEKATMIAVYLKILEQANYEAGVYLYKPMFFPSLISRLKKRKELMNEKFCRLQDLTSTSIKDADFKSVVERNQRTTLISNHLGKYLTNISERKMKKNSMDFSTLKDSIPAHINDFIRSSFTESGTTEKVLSGLKPAATMDDPIFDDLSQLYAENTRNLFEEVKSLVEKIKTSAEDAQCYDDSIVIIKNLSRSLDSGLKNHLPQVVPEISEELFDAWTTARRKQESEIDFDRVDFDITIRKFVKKLDNSAPSSKFMRYMSNLIMGRSSATYDRLKSTLRDEIIQRYNRGCLALKRREFVALKKNLEFLGLTDLIAGKHVSLAATKLSDLEQQAIKSFQSLCKQSEVALRAEKCREFEPLFADFREFVLHITCIMEDNDATKSFRLTNQLVYERLCEDITTLETTLDGFEFNAIKQKIQHIRRFGGFIADAYSLFHEDLKGYSHVKNDKWLGDLKSKISEHFQNGRDLKRIKLYAILGAPPSASKTALKKAYKKKCLACHPDKCKDKRYEQDWKDKFQIMNNAYHELDAHFMDMDHCSEPFDDALRGLGDKLRDTTRNSLSVQHYDHVETLLYKLRGIEAIESLVMPKLQTDKIQDDVIDLIKNHVQRVRTEVETNWSERKYQDLNYNIKDLKMMEGKFSSYPSIFSTSWNTGIIKKVENEIEELGKDACVFLQDKTLANKARDEFRRCFMRMGAVLVELPEFKDYTKKVMSDILESCLNSNWGYSFVFELGLSLQKGGEIEDKNDEGEARIAQILVSEFRYFKEVLTMVWNEETIQKPPEETIGGIRGQYLDRRSMKMTHVHLDTDNLLEQYFEFDSAYTSFLGEYLSAEADVKALVRKIIGSCDTLKPVSCDHGFGAETKLALPSILAGVFAVFTIVKSGESYNRVEQDDNGCAIDAKKLLMKPHNIQVLTLLCMFGCGASGSASLKSQLMQIRTGEGKSMILGAAAIIFGLLGFRVRCVCYSEYLSNRDYELFRDVFDHFGLLPLINYSKITTLSEETTATKGDIRGLTLSLLRGNLPHSGGLDGSLAVEKCGDQEMDDVGQEMDTSITMNAEVDSSSTRSSRTKTRSNSRNTSLTKFKDSLKTLQKANEENIEEIMLVDEVDVFFGSEFYGQTYNQVAQLKEPEVATILRQIWINHKQGRKRQRLADIKALSAYKNLTLKVPGYDYLIENEVALMLDQVRRVDDEPLYHFDHGTGMIGYKVQDAICYNVTFGYRTVFAYLKEADDGNLKDRNTTLSRVLTMPISCGQFSYANIKPKRILGVSGTLEVMSDYEKGVLQKYGVEQYLYVPSVYGKSNFDFDKAGDGVSIEQGVSEFFQKITDEISSVATKKKRAVIVFFGDSKRLTEYTSSAFYRKLGRKKEILTESKNANEKSFVISKAATSGQITLCTSVFGRGTDFFCKDDTLENNGGVHVIQTFLSADMSEEIQIQGRTARQGKHGSYKLILCDKDLEDDFGIKVGSSDRWPRSQFYTKLCDARKTFLEEKYAIIETNLLAAKEQDKATHEYFDAMLDSNSCYAKNLLKDMYLKMKKAHVGQMDLDLAFAIDITGSMTAYGSSIASTIQSLLIGQNSILAKLEVAFPDTEFTLRVAILGFRDIDDGSKRQFQEMCLNVNSHFSENMQDVLHFVKTLTTSFSGGADIAEDHLGAIQQCLNWNLSGDWEGTIKALLLLTDAPAHGHAPKSTTAQNIDNYSVRHPSGLTVDSVVDKLVQKDIDLFVCSFDPFATAKFEDALGEKYNNHPSNDGREVTLVPLVSKSKVQNSPSGVIGDCRKHNVFVLDESGSMSHYWNGVESVFNKYIQNRRQRQHDSDLVSIVQFDSSARVTCQMQNIVNAPKTLDYSGGGTCFAPAATSACSIALKTPSSHAPVVIFMSDGHADDWQNAAGVFAALNQKLRAQSEVDLELHVIGFGGGTDTTQLQHIAQSSPNGRVHTASDIDSLSKVFVQIAGGGDAVASVLEAEIGKRISDAVTDRLSAEYLG